MTATILKEIRNELGPIFVGQLAYLVMFGAALFFFGYVAVEVSRAAQSVGDMIGAIPVGQ